MSRRIPLLTLLGAEAIASLGRAMTLIAIPWFVLQTTGSGAKTGLVAGAETLGLLLSAGLTGPLIDRVGARRMSGVADLLTAAAVAAIPVAHLTVGMSLPVVMLLAAAIGAGRSPSRSAKQVLLPDAMTMAGTKMERATSAQEGVFKIGDLLGAPLGGLLIAVLGPPQVLLLDAATLLVSAVLVTTVVRVGGPKPEPDVSKRPSSGSSYLADLKEGVASLRSDRLLLTVATLAAATNALFVGLFAVLVPAYGARVWHSSTLVGIVVAGVGAGSLVGTLLYGWLGSRVKRWPVFCGAFLLCNAPTYLAFVSGLPPAALVAMVVVSSVGSGPLNPLIAGIKYDRVPPELRGRVFGAIAAVAFAVMPLGSLLAGVLLDGIGLPATIWTFAALSLAVTVCPLVFPVWRKMDEPALVPAAAQASGRTSVR